MTGADSNSDEQALDLVTGQREQVVRSRTAGVFVGTDNGGKAWASMAMVTHRTQEG